MDSTILFQQNVKQEYELDICTLLETYEDSLTNSFMSCFDVAWKQFQLMQFSRLKGDLSYVCISFLRTGVLLNSAWFQLDFLDKKGWGNIEECSVEWDINPVSTVIYSHINYLDNSVQSAEQKDKVLITCAEKLVNNMASFTARLVANKKTYFPKVEFRYGCYMGEYRTI